MSVDPRKKRLIGTAGLVLLALVLYLCLIFSFRTQEEIEKIIEEYPALGEHDRMCLSIPRPSDFELFHKGIGGNNRTVSISYMFTSRLYFDQVRESYSNLLNPLGWRETNFFDEGRRGRYFTLRKDDVALYVSVYQATGDDKLGTYDVTCSRYTK